MTYSSDTKRGDFGGVEPCHTQPPDGEPGVEKEQHQDGEDLGDFVASVDQIVKTCQDGHGGAHKDCSPKEEVSPP